MTVVRRRLFWKIYATLLVSLVAATLLTSAAFWFVGEAIREGVPSNASRKPWPRQTSLYDSDRRLVAARGEPITLADRAASRHWGPGHVLRLDLPDGRFVLTRFGPPPGVRVRGFLMVLLGIAGVVGLAAYPVTALLTRRLEKLRAGVARWGDRQGPIHLDESGSDEVALLASTFNATAKKLDAMLAAQKALLANASHELRSPLARLRVAVEVGDGGTKRDEIVRNLAEMDQLVDELLLSSRLDHPDVHAQRHETVDLLGLAAEEAARIQASASGEPVEICGDPVLLRRLIRNLLENAGKHGQPPVEILVGRQVGAAQIAVTDAGPGIAVADRTRIFEPFYRPAGSAESAGGWGLGLALVRQIAERHGGSVACDEAPGGGSRFVVLLAEL